MLYDNLTRIRINSADDDKKKLKDIIFLGENSSRPSLSFVSQASAGEVEQYLDKNSNIQFNLDLLTQIRDSGVYYTFNKKDKDVRIKTQAGSEYEKLFFKIRSPFADNDPYNIYNIDIIESYLNCRKLPNNLDPDIEVNKTDLFPDKHILRKLYAQQCIAKLEEKPLPLEKEKEGAKEKPLPLEKRFFPSPEERKIAQKAFFGCPGKLHNKVGVSKTGLIYDVFQNCLTFKQILEQNKFDVHRISNKDWARITNINIDSADITDAIEEYLENSNYGNHYNNPPNTFPLKKDVYMRMWTPNNFNIYVSKDIYSPKNYVSAVLQMYAGMYNTNLFTIKNVETSEKISTVISNKALLNPEVACFLEYREYNIPEYGKYAVNLSIHKSSLDSLPFQQKVQKIFYHLLREHPEGIEIKIRSSKNIFDIPDSSIPPLLKKIKTFGCGYREEFLGSPEFYDLCDYIKGGGEIPTYIPVSSSLDIKENVFGDGEGLVNIFKMFVFGNADARYKIIPVLNCIKNGGGLEFLWISDSEEEVEIVVDNSLINQTLQFVLTMVSRQAEEPILTPFVPKIYEKRSSEVVYEDKVNPSVPWISENKENTKNIQSLLKTYAKVFWPFAQHDERLRRDFQMFLLENLKKYVLGFFEVEIYVGGSGEFDDFLKYITVKTPSGEILFTVVNSEDDEYKANYIGGKNIKKFVSLRSKKIGVNVEAQCYDVFIQNTRNNIDSQIKAQKFPEDPLKLKHIFQILDSALPIENNIQNTESLCGCTVSPEYQYVPYIKNSVLQYGTIMNVSSYIIDNDQREYITPIFGKIGPFSGNLFEECDFPGQCFRVYVETQKTSDPLKKSPASLTSQINIYEFFGKNKCVVSESYKESPMFEKSVRDIKKLVQTEDNTFQLLRDERGDLFLNVFDEPGVLYAKFPVKNNSYELGGPINDEPLYEMRIRGDQKSPFIKHLSKSSSGPGSKGFPGLVFYLRDNNMYSYVLGKINIFTKKIMDKIKGSKNPGPLSSENIAREIKQLKKCRGLWNDTKKELHYISQMSERQIHNMILVDRCAVVESEEHCSILKKYNKNFEQ